jgi:hypothetical protein
MSGVHEIITHEAKKINYRVYPDAALGALKTDFHFRNRGVAGV